MIDRTRRDITTEYSYRANLSNWRTYPFCNWSFHNVREIVPSAEIRNEPSNIWPMKYKKAPFRTGLLKKFINKSATDAVVIIQDSNIYFEDYRNGMGPDDQHILFSVSKSILGIVAGCLIHDGVIKEEHLITDYLPEMRGTAYEKATIRHALDMLVGVAFNEDYTTEVGPMIDYRHATNWNPTPDSKVAINLKEFLSSLSQSSGPHGRNFKYTSPNTDLLAWLFERASERRYHELISKYLWRPLGTERAAYITVDRVGAMRAAGGVCTTARDLGRLGMLVAQYGKRDTAQIIPKNWILDLCNGGSQDTWNKGNLREFFSSSSMHYRSKWYVDQSIGRLLFAFGIHGQYLFIDCERKLSMVWLSSQTSPLDGNTIKNILDQVNAIRIAFD